MENEERTSEQNQRCAHPVMDIETGLCTDCGEPIDCPVMLDFGMGDAE